MTNQELLAIVRAARALVSDPGKWNSRNYAEDEGGRWVPVGSARAVTFNLMGALVKAAGIFVRDALGPILQVFSDVSPELYAQMQHPSQPLTREHALEILDCAIAQLNRATAQVATSAEVSGKRGSALKVFAGAENRHTEA